MENSDESWQPPSEGELKIMQARRERQDRISKVMGQYLLKGYKMLDAVCPICQTVLLRPKGSTEDYCVACSELDSDVAKDDPALDPVAARSQILEKQNATTSNTQHHQASTSFQQHPPSQQIFPAGSHSNVHEEVRSSCHHEQPTQPATPDHDSSQIHLKNAFQNVSSHINLVSQRLTHANTLDVDLRKVHLLQQLVDVNKNLQLLIDKNA